MLTTFTSFGGITGYLNLKISDHLACLLLCYVLYLERKSLLNMSDAFGQIATSLVVQLKKHVNDIQLYYQP